MNAQDEEWGEERLIACAKTCCGLTAREALDRLMSGAVAFAAALRNTTIWRCWCCVSSLDIAGKDPELMANPAATPALLVKTNAPTGRL
jgi:hypothetical protein